MLGKSLLILSLTTSGVFLDLSLARTRLTVIHSDPSRDGFLKSLPALDQACAAAMVDSTSELRVGRDPGGACGEFRSYLSFEVASLREGQLASAHLIFYQSAISTDPPAPVEEMEVHLVDFGLNLDLFDWALPSLAMAADHLPVADGVFEYRIDVTALLSFALETGRNRLQLRLVSPSATSESGFISVSSGDAPEGEFRPRLEVVMAQPVATPVRLVAGNATPILTPGAGDTFVGVALANPANPPNRARTAYYSSGGAQALLEDRGLIPRNGQNAFVLSPPPEASMMVAKGNTGALQGFFMLGDNSLKRLDGVGGELPESDTLYVPVVREGSSGHTQLFLFRSTSTLEQDVEITLFNETGERTAERILSLTGPGVESGSLDDLLEPDAGLQRGYLRISSSAGVQGLALFVGQSALGSLAALPSSRTKQLFAPHLFVSADAGSELSLLNLEERSVDARIRAQDDNGELLGQVAVTLAPHSLLSRDLAELLSLERPASGLLTGHLEVVFDPASEGGAVSVMGAISFGADDGSYLSVLPLVDQGRAETLILQVAQSAPLRIFTGLALLNPDTLPAEIRITVFNRSGTITGVRSVTLQGESRLVDLLNGSPYFGPGFTQVGGHIRVVSNRPIITFAIFGDFDLRYLAAIESQRPTAQFEGVDIIRNSCGSDSGPSLVSWIPDPRTLESIELPSGRSSRIQLVLWDNSEEISPLGGLRKGVSDVEWELSDLDKLGIQAISRLEVASSPYSVRSLLDLNVPAGVSGRAVLRLTATDVSGCATEIGFPITLGGAE